MSVTVFSPFVFGIDGIRKPSPESLELLKETEACGVILFAKNIENPKQVRGLINNLEDTLGRKLLVMIDHEGGLICRFATGVTHFPGNLALGKTRNPLYAYKVGQAMAAELTPLGINVNLAPVLDVLAEKGQSPAGRVPVYNPGITTRSFGSDTQLVARMGCEMIRGMQEGGLSACAKHFPGKGAATLDAHDTLPTIKLSRKTFFQRDLLPFKAAIKTGVELVMSTHIECPALEKGPDAAGEAPKKRDSPPSGTPLSGGTVPGASPAASVPTPATFSRKIITNLLRKELGFEGVVITDDLGMGAITERATPAEAACKAASAGHDILLICHNPKAQLEAFKAYQEALERGEVSLEEHKSRLERIECLMKKGQKKGTVPMRGQSPFSLPEGQGLARQIAEKSVRIVQQGALKVPLNKAKKPYFIVPDLSPLKSRFTFEPEMEDLRLFIHHWLTLKNTQPKILTAPLQKQHKIVICQGLTPIFSGKPIIFFCFDATNNEFQKKLLDDLQADAGSRLIIVLIRNPWDIRLIRKNVTVIDALGFRKVQLETALNILFR